MTAASFNSVIVNTCNPENFVRETPDCIFSKALPGPDFLGLAMVRHRNVETRADQGIDYEVKILAPKDGDDMTFRNTMQQR